MVGIQDKVGMAEFNYDLHVCDEFKIPTDWPVVALIDFHPLTEQAIGFMQLINPVGSM